MFSLVPNAQKASFVRPLNFLKVAAFSFTQNQGVNFNSRESVLRTAMMFEDNGTSALNGGGQLLKNPLFLLIAGKLVSVEARHAAMVRRLRGETPWIIGDSRGTLPAPTQPVYNGDGNTKQGTVNVASLPGLNAKIASQAFDEPLSKAEVSVIAGMFIRK